MAVFVASINSIHNDAWAGCQTKTVKTRWEMASCYFIYYKAKAKGPLKGLPGHQMKS